MRIDFGGWRERRAERLARWHLWFAWHPVWMGDGVLTWLETIERMRYRNSGSTWHYRNRTT